MASSELKMIQVMLIGGAINLQIFGTIMNGLAKVRFFAEINVLKEKFVFCQKINTNRKKMLFASQFAVMEY